MPPTRPVWLLSTRVIVRSSSGRGPIAGDVSPHGCTANLSAAPFPVSVCSVIRTRTMDRALGGSVSALGHPWDRDRRSRCFRSWSVLASGAPSLTTGAVTPTDSFRRRRRKAAASDAREQRCRTGRALLIDNQPNDDTVEKERWNLGKGSKTHVGTAVPWQNDDATLLYFCG